MRFRRPRRRWVVIAAIAVLVVLSLRALDRPALIYYYCNVHDRTMQVATITGTGTSWTRVTDLTESPTTVTVSVSLFLLQIGPGTDVGAPVETQVTLNDPLGSRSVVDGNSGLSVSRGTCDFPFPFQTAGP